MQVPHARNKKKWTFEEKFLGNFFPQKISQKLLFLNGHNFSENGQKAWTLSITLVFWMVLWCVCSFLLFYSEQYFFSENGFFKIFGIPSSAFS